MEKAKEKLFRLLLATAAFKVSTLGNALTVESFVIKILFIIYLVIEIVTWVKDWRK